MSPLASWLLLAGLWLTAVWLIVGGIRLGARDDD